MVILFYNTVLLFGHFLLLLLRGCRIALIALVVGGVTLYVYLQPTKPPPSVNEVLATVPRRPAAAPAPFHAVLFAQEERDGVDGVILGMDLILYYSSYKGTVLPLPKKRPRRRPLNSTINISLHFKKKKQMSNYKSRLCRHFSNGKCDLGVACQFAHGLEDLRGGDTVVHLGIERPSSESPQPDARLVNTTITRKPFTYVDNTQSPR